MAQPIVTTRILRRLLKTGAHFRAEKLLERIHPADLGPVLSDLSITFGTGPSGVVVPLPSSFALLGIGCLTLLAGRRLRRRRED